MGLNNLNLDNVNLEDDNFEEDYPETVSVRVMAWRNRFKQCKAFNKDISKDVTSVACFKTR